MFLKEAAYKMKENFIKHIYLNSNMLYFTNNRWG